MAGARRKHPPTKPGDIAVAVGVVLAGLVLIAAIVLGDPRWQRVVASRPDGFAGAPTVAVPKPPESSSWAAPEPAPSQPVLVSPARAESTTQVTRAPSGAKSDPMQIMATLLVSQLGRDPAWRIAVANAEAHDADSPEHAYWRGVAAAIRDGLRPRQ